MNDEGMKPSFEEIERAIKRLRGMEQSDASAKHPDRSGDCLPLDRVFTAIGLSDKEREHLGKCDFCKRRVRAFGKLPEDLRRPVPTPLAQGRQAAAPAVGPHPWWPELAAKAAVVLFVLGILAAGAGAVLVEKYNARLKELVKLRKQYDEAWAALRFEEIIKPIPRVLQAEQGHKPDMVSVEFSPRIEEGLVSRVGVFWGDGGNASEIVYDETQGIKHFQAVHEYALPVPGRTDSWTLRIAFEVPDAVQAARSFRPEELASECRVEATADGVRLVAGSESGGVKPKLAEAQRPKISIRSPSPEEEVGWRASVTLKSPAHTEQVTLLVRPHSENVFYVQPDSRPLSAEIEESFDVQFSSKRTQDVGTDFDILIVCADNFKPRKWALNVSEVPYSSVIDRITVRKAAGTMHLAPDADLANGLVNVQGQIWTPDGGALLVSDGRTLKVARVFQASPTGGRVDEKLTIPASESNAVYLLVCKEGAEALHEGQTLTDIAKSPYWLYGPARKSEEVRP
jgi:hypothetical protein